MKLKVPPHVAARAASARPRSRIDAFLDAFCRDHADHPEKLRQLGPGLRAFVDEWAATRKDRSHGRP